MDKTPSSKKVDLDSEEISLLRDQLEALAADVEHVLGEHHPKARLARSILAKLAR